MQIDEGEAKRLGKGLRSASKGIISLITRMTDEMF
jgi:hypothetical protein